jgi:hypothetical protein
LTAQDFRFTVWKRQKPFLLLSLSKAKEEHSMPLAPASRASYSQSLRVIGQFLQTLKPKDFEIQLLQGEITVRLRVMEVIIPPTPPKPKFSFRAPPPAPATTRETTSERRYSIQEIEELDREGQTKRVNTDAPTDFYSLSQMLRTVGSYVDHRHLRLLDLNWDGSRLVLRLEGADGRSGTEEHAVSSFHDYFSRMYLRRKR